ncbi:hypothetical protein Tco_0882416 [Tanacetum coccineum]
MSPRDTFPVDMSPGKICSVAGKRCRGKLEGDSFPENFPWRHHGAHRAPPNFQSTNLVPRWTRFPSDMSPGILRKHLGHPVVTTHGRRDHANLLLELLVASFELIDIGSVIASRHGDIEDVLAPSRQNPTNTENVPPLLASMNNGHDLIIDVDVDPHPARIRRQQYVYRRRSGLGTGTLESRSYASVHTQVSSILSTPDHVLGIKPKPDLRIPIFRRDIHGTSGSDSFYVMLIDALSDFWPKLGLHVGLQVKLGLQSYITKTDLEI